MKRTGSCGARWWALCAVFALLSGSCARREQPEWKKVQAEYARLLASSDIKGAAPAKSGIREKRSAMTAVVERCTTCHLGVDEPALRDAAAPQPLRRHPDVPHAAGELGCTDCHRGSPAALTAREAHGGTSPTLPLRFTESSCGRCHPDRVLAEAPHLTEGRLLLARLGCAGCHEIPGFENERNTGYDLDGLGSKVSRAWLVKWLAHPKGYLPSTTMPAFGFTSAEIESLADFLLSSKDDRVEALARQVRAAAPAAAPAARASRGEAAVARLGCASCHAFSGKGGRVGPDLGKSGEKLRPEWLLAWLKYPREFFAGTRMPQYSFPDQEIVGIADYLVAASADRSREDFRSAMAQGGSRGERSAPRAGSGIDSGRRLFVSSGCVGCHALRGVSRPASLAPALSGIGDRSEKDLRFGAATIDRTLASWLKAKVISPHVFDPTLRMPDFQLNQTEADDVTTALLSLSKDVPKRLAVRTRGRRAPEPSQDVAEVFAKYRCLDCHTLGEKGQPLAMDLARAGSKLDRDWLAAYLKKPYAMRPLVKERMPAFGLSDREVSLLVDFFQSTCVDPNVGRSPFAAGAIPAAEIEKGRRLFHEDLGCRACHIVGSEGGVYGPSLNGAGTRMTAAWIYAWIRSPRKLDPSTRTPDYGLAPDAARALTAYIASQRTQEAALRAEPERHLAVSESPIPEEVKGPRRYEAEKGRAVYFRYCAFCHGESGRGDGPSVERLGKSPTDFTSVDAMAHRKRDALVRAVSEGGRSVGRSSLMPPYGRTLTPRQIEEVVTYLQTFTSLQARFKYSSAASPCEETKKKWAALEAFSRGAPTDALSAVQRLKGELDAVLRDPSGARCDDIGRRIEEETAALSRRLDALVARDDVDALDRILSAQGKPPLPLPRPGRSWGESAAAYRAFNEEVQSRGKAALSGRAITWDVWKTVLSGLRTGSFPPEHRALLPELERMGLVDVKVELKG